MKPQRWYEKTDFGFIVYDAPRAQYATANSLLFGVNTLRELRAMYPGFALAPIWGD